MQQNGLMRRQAGESKEHPGLNRNSFAPISIGSTAWTGRSATTRTTPEGLTLPRTASPIDLGDRSQERDLQPASGLIVELPCRMQFSDGEWLDGELRMLGAGEALLRCPALEHRASRWARAGMSLRLRLTEAETPQTLAGEIKACDGQTLTLSLTHTDPAQREGLRVQVQHLLQARQARMARRRGQRPAAIALAHCRDALAAFLGSRFPRVFEGARDALFNLARDATTDCVQTECFDAMQEVERLRRTIEQGTLQATLAAVDAMHAPRPATPAAAPRQEPMALVDTNSLNDWLTVVAIVTRTRETLRESERRLGWTLANLLGRVPEDDENPFAAQKLASAFHDALQNLGAEKRTRRALFAAFECVVIDELPRLHEELGNLLARDGVEPGREPRPVIVKTPETQRPRGDQRAASPPEKVPARRPSRHDLETPPAAADTAEAKPGPVTVPGDAAPTASNAGNRDLGVMDSGRLLRLCGSLLGSASARGVGDNASGANVVGDTELDERLAALQVEVEATTPDDRDTSALARRLGEGLLRQGRRLRETSADSLTTGASFVDTLLQDPLLDETARGFLRTLAMPLLRAVVLDPGFLAQPTHPVRRLLDEVGGLTGSIPAADGRHASLLLEEAADTLFSSPRPDGAAFAAALPPLSTLRAEQRRVVTERIQELVRGRARRSAAAREWRRRLGADDSEHCERASVPAEWRNWLEQARRLDTGHVLLASSGEGPQRPLWLVWKDAESQSFLLADANGSSPDMLTRQELAMALRRGTLRLQPIVSSSLVERTLLAVLGRALGSAEDAAKRDPLTGLGARRPLEWHLQKALARCQPQVEKEYLLLSQVDGFDAITRRCGHEAAGRLLSSFADILRRHFGQSGTATRLYGSRFAVLVDSHSRSDLLARAERLRRSVAQARCMFRGEALSLSVSVAVLPLDVRLDGPDQALQLAEDVLARATTAGGNRVRIEEFRAPAPDCRQDHPFGELLAAGLIGLRCQRVQPLRAGEVLPYYEVLLGVREANGTLAPPGRLIAAAERSGEIATLDRWVVAEALSWLGRNSSHLQGIGGLAINLSGVTLCDEALLPFIVQQLRVCNLAPHRVMFEVTESATIADMTTALSVLHGLREHGCRLALDDFGTGSSSFAYLKQLPVDTVKIDGLFVRDMLGNDSDRAMVQSINEIAHCLGRATVAEFAESEAIVTALRELGVDYAQGHAVARPQPLDSLLDQPLLAGCQLPADAQCSAGAALAGTRPRHQPLPASEAPAPPFALASSR